MKNAVLLSLMLVAPAAMAHDHRHHDAHVHGQANITLPTQFSGLHQVVVNALGPNGQSRSELTASRQRVELAR